MILILTHNTELHIVGPGQVNWYNNQYSGITSANAYQSPCAITARSQGGNHSRDMRHLKISFTQTSQCYTVPKHTYAHITKHDSTATNHRVYCSAVVLRHFCRTDGERLCLHPEGREGQRVGGGVETRTNEK